MFHYRDYIYCVYQEKSFTKAAEKLHVSQPSLSALVRKEEESIGQPIFNRKTTPISLTLFGSEYIKSIETVYDLEERLKSMSSDLNMLQTGALAISASNLGIPHFVPQTLVQYKQCYPNVHLSVIEASTIKAKHMLDTGAIDLIITSQPLDQDGYEVQLCYQEQLIIAVPKEYQVNQKLTDNCLQWETPNSDKTMLVSLQEFEHTPFILLNRGNYLRSCTDMLFREAQIEPEVVLEVEQSSVAYNFANYGLGAAFFSSRFISRDYFKNLKYYAIASEYAQRKGYVCFRRGCYVTTAMQQFIQMLRNAAEEHGTMQYYLQ